MREWGGNGAHGGWSKKERVGGRWVGSKRGCTNEIFSSFAIKLKKMEEHLMGLNEPKTNCSSLSVLVSHGDEGLTRSGGSCSRYVAHTDPVSPQRSRPGSTAVLCQKASTKYATQPHSECGGGGARGGGSPE